MNTERLRTALENVAKVHAALDMTASYMMRLSEPDRALRNPATAEPSMLALIEALRNDPELEIFNNKALVIAGVKRLFTYATLASWLISRTTKIDETLEDLATYLNAKEFQCDQVLAFYGLDLDQPADLGDGISLLPWERLPESPEKQMVSFSRTQIIHMISGKPSALYRSFKTIKRHIKAESDTLSQKEHTPEFELHDALICIGLAMPWRWQILASWVGIPKWVPTFSPYEPSRSIDQCWPKKLLPEALAEAKKLFASFHKRDQNTKAHIRLAMERLNQMAEKGVVDAAIDLGIALETLYLNDPGEDRGELTFRMKIRSARFLGRDEADRQRIFDLVGELYTLRSAAVHKGKLPAKYSVRSVREVLDKGFDLGTQTVRRFIVEGSPNWNEVQMN